MAEGVTLTEEQRLPIRELCLKSTYAFAKFVCDFPDLDGDFHGMMCRWIEKPTRLKLGLAPRSHFKSHVWTMADKLRRVTVDPNLRVCITNEVLENSIKFISVMQSIVQNPIYKWLFPENVPDPLKVRWNQTQLELKRPRKHPQPTVEVFGVGGTPTSNHYDIIVNDDLATNKARESPVVMEDAIQQRQLAWSLMVDPTTSEVHDIGTRWHPQDVHDWVLKNVKEVDFLKLSVWREPGIPWFPKRFPPHVLEQIRLEQGAVLWSLNYLNEPIGEGVSDFNINLLNHYTLIQNEKGEDVIRLEKKVGGETKTRSVLAADCLKFQLIDAGLSPESRDARTANVVVALCPPEGNEPFDIVVLESSAVKAGPAGVISAAKEVYDRWDPFSASIEVFGGHVVFFNWLQREYPTMRLRKLPTDTKKSKDTRIREFYPFIEQGRVYVHRKTSTDLVDEMAAYPNGKTVDLLDALAYAPKVWVPPAAKDEKKKRPPGVTDFDLADNLEDENFVGPGGNQGRSAFTGY
jgi:hypothetical protein